jgi:hypothetical protein
MVKCVINDKLCDIVRLIENCATLCREQEILRSILLLIKEAHIILYIFLFALFQPLDTSF